MLPAVHETFIDMPCSAGDCKLCHCAFLNAIHMTYGVPCWEQQAALLSWQNVCPWHSQECHLQASDQVNNCVQQCANMRVQGQLQFVQHLLVHGQTRLASTSLTWTGHRMYVLAALCDHLAQLVKPTLLWS